MKHDETKCSNCGWGYKTAYIEKHGMCKTCKTGHYEPDISEISDYDIEEFDLYYG